MFLTETDLNILEEGDYTIEGYKTIFPKRIANTDKIRIVALVKNDIENNIKVMNDVMNEDFPSIWLELISPNSKSIL